MIDLAAVLLFCSGVKALLDVAERGLAIGERAVKFVDSAAQTHALISGISTGRAAEARLHAQSSNTILKLSDDVFLDRNIVEAVNLEQKSAVVGDTYLIRDALTSIAKQTKSKVLSSQVSFAPALMRQTLEADPFAFLVDLQPAWRISKPPNDNYVPILISLKGQPHIGWQMRGALNGLFGCSFSPSLAADQMPPASIVALMEKNLRSFAENYRLFLNITDETARRALSKRGVDASAVWMSVGFPTPIEVGYRAPAPYLHFSGSRVFCTGNFDPLDYDSSVSMAGFMNSDFVRGMFSSHTLMIKSRASREKIRLYVDEPILAADVLQYIQRVIGSLN